MTEHAHAMMKRIFFRLKTGRRILVTTVMGGSQSENHRQAASLRGCSHNCLLEKAGCLIGQDKARRAGIRQKKEPGGNP